VGYSKRTLFQSCDSPNGYLGVQSHNRKSSIQQIIQSDIKDTAVIELGSIQMKIEHIKPKKIEFKREAKIRTINLFNSLTKPDIMMPAFDSSQYGYVMSEGRLTSKRTCCNCRRSKCLKLYCECFSSKLHCNNCSCQNCHNLPKYEDTRMSLMQIIEGRNSKAFKPKMVIGFDPVNLIAINNLA
jgi:hypothetical protein